MRLRIAEEHPGELEAKAEDVVRTIERLTGRELMVKAAPGCGCGDPLCKSNHKVPRAPMTFDHEAIDQMVGRSKREVDQIRKLMDKRIAEVLNG